MVQCLCKVLMVLTVKKGFFKKQLNAVGPFLMSAQELRSCHWYHGSHQAQERRRGRQWRGLCRDRDVLEV